MAAPGGEGVNKMYTVTIKGKFITGTTVDDKEQAKKVEVIDI